MKLLEKTRQSWVEVNKKAHKVVSGERVLLLLAHFLMDFHLIQLLQLLQLLQLFHFHSQLWLEPKKVAVEPVCSNRLSSQVKGICELRLSRGGAPNSIDAVECKKISISLLASSLFWPPQAPACLARADKFPSFSLVLLVQMEPPRSSFWNRRESFLLPHPSSSLSSSSGSNPSPNRSQLKG